MSVIGFFVDNLAGSAQVVFLVSQSPATPLSISSWRLTSLVSLPIPLCCLLIYQAMCLLIYADIMLDRSYKYCYYGNGTGLIISIIIAESPQMDSLTAL